MLKDLYELQKLEVREREIAEAAKKSAAYKEMKTLRADFDAKKETYQAAEADLASLAEQLSAFPAEIREVEEKIKAENKAIYDGSVGNMKELNARENQAAALEDKLKELQSLNTLYTGEQEQKIKAQEELKLLLARDHAAFEEAKAAYQEIQAESEKQLADLEAQREEIVKGISADDMSWYETVRYKCNGSPIARLDSDQVCSGCHTIVPPVTYYRTLRGEQTYCEKCGRYLFTEATEPVRPAAKKTKAKAKPKAKAADKAEKKAPAGKKTAAKETAAAKETKKKPASKAKTAAKAKAGDKEE
ncbi:MAG: hypothetical protein IIZ45_06065 [Firmicutes bacterium]|nr:hypothetical protein [Bacillota bacterium]